MGNDSSRLKGLIIDKNSVEANDFWTLYNAESPTTSNEEGRQLLSVFQGEPVVTGQLWVAQGPLERAIKNYRIYRHPYILKYVTTWEQGGQKHLATERVRPLTALLTTQNDIQVCLGLRTILCSLIFLIEKAMGRHLNICTSSIYITSNGSWRLAGFEYVWKQKDVTKILLDLVNSYRYSAAIDPSETKENNSDAIEQYAFATLCEEVLQKCSKNEATATPYVQEFREYCATHLKHKNAQLRPRLSAVLLHPYFNHEFVLIHSFLFELPLKGLQEKQDFFTGLVDRLRYFNEEIVGAQLAADLLSRMVLLDTTAQLCVTPYVLKTKTDHSAALFSNQTYVRHIMPHIKKMFRLRDAQIRLILLEYFMEFVRLLTKEELLEHILPHLLEGMNDTNDVLVAKTLRCLADLVPILGSATVIGGNRSRIFSDGRPQAAVPDSTSHWVEPRSITPVMGNNIDYMVSDSPIPDNVDLSSSFNSLPQVENNEQLDMPPRLSPDGGEDDKSGIITDGINAVQSQQQQDQSTHSSDLPQTEEELIIGGVMNELLSETVNDFADHMRDISNNITPNNENHFIANISMNENADDDDDDGAWSDWETDELQRLNDNAIESNELRHIDLRTSPTLISIDIKNNTTSTTTVSNTALPSNCFDNVSTKTSSTVTNGTLLSYATVPTQNSVHESNASSSYLSTKSAKSAAEVGAKRALKINDDLSTLDIIVQKSAAPQREEVAEFDFFKDMEPVIEASSNSLGLLSSAKNMQTSKLELNKVDTEEVLIDTNRFAAGVDELNANDDGWGVNDEDCDAWQE